MIFGNKLFGGLKLLEQKVFEDHRGYFTESYNSRAFLKEVGFSPTFVQDNESCSKKFVIRGLHYQNGEHAQAKLVRVIKGQVIDFVLDIRETSEHYGKMLFVPLTPGVQFYIPKGFAHGFVALDDDTIFAYKCDNFYCKEAEGGFNVLDEKLQIVEKLQSYLNQTVGEQLTKLIFSEKDLLYPNFSERLDAEFKCNNCDLKNNTTTYIIYNHNNKSYLENWQWPENTCCNYIPFAYLDASEKCKWVDDKSRAFKFISLNFAKMVIEAIIINNKNLKSYDLELIENN